MRVIPLPQTLNATMVARVMPATHHSAALTGAACGPSNERSPAMPADRPIMKITSPDISGGNIERSRWRSGASAASSTPAKNVMPNTSGSPPSFAASSEGAK